MTMFHRLLHRLKQAHRDRSGASAVEFALIAPILLLLFAGTAEFGLDIMTRMQVNEAVSSAANSALLSGPGIAAATADGTATTLATILRRSRGGAAADAKIRIVFNGTRIYDFAGSQVTPSGNAAAVDECRCPTRGSSIVVWGSAVTCNTQCADGSFSGRYVLIDLSRPYKPLFAQLGLVDSEGIRVTALAQVQ